MPKAMRRNRTSFLAGSTGSAEGFVDRIQADPIFFVEECLSVIPMEGGGEVPFLLNPGQRVVMDTLRSELAKGSYVRLIILKSRRQGISTLSEAIMYWLASCFQNNTTLVLAHDKDTSQVLFRMAQGFHDTDRRHELGIMPSVERSSRQGITFGNPDKKTRHIDRGLGSSMLVETAEGKSVGRGLTLAGYHWAEVAYTLKQDVATGLNIACSKTPGTIGIWESTANGVGDAFETTWLNSQTIQEDPDKRNDFVGVFLPWNIDPNCRRNLTKEEKENWTFLAGEEDLAKQYSLDLEQLKFRRVVIASPECHRPGVAAEDVFRQEYPLCWQEAFLRRGRNFFLIPSLDALRKSDKGEKKPEYYANVRCPLTPVELLKKISAAPVLPEVKKVPYGPLQVWEPPKDGQDYIVAGDPAEGVSNDASIAIVLRRRPLGIVARFESRHMDPDEFGILCGMLGWWYNTGLVGVERNGPGNSANKALRALHYPRCFYDRDVHNIDEPVKSFMGWHTNAGNRRPTLDRLEEAIRKAELEIPSRNFYEEARKFILVEATSSTGTTYAKPQASPGCRDDEIMATAIAIQLHIHGGAVRGEPAKPTISGVDFAAPKPKEPRKSNPRSIYDLREYDYWDKW